MRVLLIAHSFPPIGGGRSIAWAYFSKYLQEEFSIDVDVLTVQALPGDPMYNKDRLNIVPASIDVYRTYPGPLYSILYRSGGREYHKQERNRGTYSVISRLYESCVRPLFFPDRMVEWLPYAFVKANDLVKKHNYRCLITLGFPFSTHLLGYFLRKRYSLKWIVDYGDPWSFNESPETIPQWRKCVDRIIEGRVIKHADRIIVTNDETKAGFLNHFSFLNASRIIVIPQGFDKNLYKENISREELNFTIAYTGTFYRNIRNPRYFFSALQKCDFNNLAVVLAGPNLEDYLPRDSRVRYMGVLGPYEVANLQKRSTMLLLIGNNSVYQTPGKLFEYLGAKRPILMISNGRNDLAAKFVQNNNIGVVVPNNEDEIVKVLNELVTDWHSGVLERRFKLNQFDFDFYEWRNLSCKVAAIVNEV